MGGFKRAVRPFVPAQIWGALARGRQQAVSLQTQLFGYNRGHVKAAWKLVAEKRPRILVVGANDGSDCKGFIDLGADEVHGIDIEDTVGCAFQHDKVFYHRGDIQRSALPSNYFDLVFSRSTMEHVIDVRAGFSEMARVTRVGGAIWSLAYPLWNSPYGHHMECFRGHPWVHLALDGKDEIVDYAHLHGITGERGHTIEAIIDYMTDERFFNMTPAAVYTDAIRSISELDIIQHDLVLLDPALLAHPFGRKALDRGYASAELRADTHALIARKTG
jgi:SAM-dependent methyltransferase